MAKWQIQPKVPQAVLEQFPELRTLVVQLLYNRGIVDPNRAEWFLNPDYHNLYDPFLFAQMQGAIDRTWQAIKNKEKILVYGDYDADAVTANAVLQQTFRYLGVEAQSYIPDRFTEGYGLNIEAFEKIKQQGVTLVITVDCGTNSVDVAEFCSANGIDLIITDHHEITGATPEAFALINPKNPEEQYPDDQITGVGVAYKFAKALLMQVEQVVQQKNIDPLDYQPEWDKWLLDLVAIGTVADCHSLLGENRILVKFGLKVLQKTKWIGLKQLVENAGLDLHASPPDSKTLGFTIAPRINAAGRLEHADIALQLLITQDFSEAISLSNRLEEINLRRKDLTNRIISEASEQAELISDRKILVLYNEAWPKGLVGIVAGRLADKYKRPVIVMEKGETEATGSARTSGEFDVVTALKAVSNRIHKFGGHKQAAGLTVLNEELEGFYVDLLRYAEDNWPDETAPELMIDAELSADDISLESFEDIAALEPFGAENPKPILTVTDAQVGTFKLVGQSKQHLQIQLMIDQTILDCIGFSMGYLAPRLDFGVKLSVAGELMADSWQGIKKLKMRLVDVQVAEPLPDEATALSSNNLIQEEI